ncbi:citrate lyase subunit beta / citryl-CoA lyase [Variovorax sp. HW608]|uniref:HpcH/HpaI aldolase/citrate lyase family protein n=1 Tax=Variovorax sp. HW608 TaxID=1034889 RepID=UPI00081FCA09|nr:CoA ester lyase [Variovorax sp. HW608]SCK17571.1 citrate lyase subunit beta / citryl-CoA lyase [Variovorax sp. HW608]
MRSKLFVPGSRPELFAKAAASEADGICLDLEDAVVEARKAEARAAVRAFLQQGGSAGGKTWIVRVNGLETPHFALDVAAVARPGLHVINLPKPETPDAVRAAAEALARAERDNGVEAPIALLLNIETPKALRNAAALAAAHPRVVGLQLGLGDLFEPLGIDRRESAAVQQALFALRMAAGEAGVYAYDSAFANVRDAQGFREEAALSRRMGFLGKSCIHPSQVALANEAFRPTDAEIAHALEVVVAADAATAGGVGAYMVGGRMIDAPFEARARAIVASARRLGLVS